MRSLYIAAFLLVPTFGLAEEMQGLIQRCAPNVHVSTMGSIVRVESNGNPFAILDNDRIGKPMSQRVLRSFRPQSFEEALTLAQELIDAGHSIDLGLGQVNSRNMKVLGVTLADLFDPCKNLGASESVLLGSYEQALRRVSSAAKALEMALSAYNTGDFKAGVANGYVRRVRQAYASGLPALRVAQPFKDGTRVASVGLRAGTGSHGVLVRRPTLLEAKLASIDVERF